MMFSTSVSENAPFVSTMVFPDEIRIESSQDIIECTVIEASGFHLHRFLIFDDLRLILVEPEVSRLGFGIVRLVTPMEHVTVRSISSRTRFSPKTVLTILLFPFLQAQQDKKDAVNLDLVTKVVDTRGKLVKWSAKLVFADHVRCMAASKHIETSQTNVKNAKMKKLREVLSC